MIPYVEEIIKNSSEEMGTLIAATPCTPSIPSEESGGGKTSFKGKEAKQFHHTVIQLMFVSIRAHMDIQTAVAYLRTRVKSPDEDD